MPGGPQGLPQRAALRSSLLTHHKNLIPRAERRILHVLACHAALKGALILDYKASTPTRGAGESRCFV